MLRAREEAARRARAKVRRYGAANRLNRLGTLTYRGEGCHDPLRLRADLAAHPAACTLAFWHHPRFSAGTHGNDPRTDRIWRALYDGGADVVLVAHNHDYERFGPQDPDGRADATQGIRQFVVGTGGRNLARFRTEAPNSEARNAETFGVLRLDLHSSGYDWRFVPESKPGSFTDSGSDVCR